MKVDKHISNMSILQIDDTHIVVEGHGLPIVLACTDGCLLYVDTYELQFNNALNLNLDGLIELHTSGEITDQEYENLVRIREHLELFKRSKTNERE